MLETCLKCNEHVFYFEDPLGCFSSPEAGDFSFLESLINNIYFRVWPWNIVDVRDYKEDISYNDLQAGYEHMKVDIANYSEELYQKFLKNHQHRSSLMFYTKDEFYEYLEGFFKYQMIFWKEVLDIYQASNGANNEEGRRKQLIKLQGMLRSWLNSLNLDQDYLVTSYFGDTVTPEFKEWEKLPYLLSFQSWEDVRVLCINKGNISPERLMELEQIAKYHTITSRDSWMKIEKVKREEIIRRYQAGKLINPTRGEQRIINNYDAPF